MKVKVIKRKTSVLGSPLFKGTQLEISDELYDLYQDEFELIEEPKVKEYKHKKEYKKGMKEEEDE